MLTHAPHPPVCFYSHWRLNIAIYDLIRKWLLLVFMSLISAFMLRSIFHFALCWFPLAVFQSPFICPVFSLLRQAKYISICIDEIKSELKQDNIAVKANAVCKLTYVRPFAHCTCEMSLCFVLSVGFGLLHQLSEDSILISESCKSQIWNGLIYL